MNVLDEMLSSYLAQDYKHTNCRVCNRKLTDPISIYMGVGPECAKALHDQLDIKLPLVWVTVDVESDTDFENEAGACYVDIFIESVCPWTEQVLYQTVIRLESVDWDSTHQERLKSTFGETSGFMDGVFDTIAVRVRYDYHRGTAEGWDMLDVLFEDVGSWDPWPEIAKQVAIVDTSYVAEIIHEHLRELPGLDALQYGDEIYGDVSVFAHDYELTPSYDDLEQAPVNLFAYDWQDEDGFYSVDAIREACNERPRALLWIFAEW